MEIAGPRGLAQPEYSLTPGRGTTRERWEVHIGHRELIGDPRKGRHRPRCRPRSRALVFYGGCFVLFAVIHALDFLHYGEAVHAVGGRGFPRIRGTQLLVASILLGIGGIAMIWSGARPAAREAPAREGGEPSDSVGADDAPDSGEQRREAGADRERER